MGASICSGGCHCGAVRFELDLLETDTGLECNCSICRKKGFLHLIVPPERFRLLRGREALTTYTFNTGVAKHTFCRHCGIHPFYTPRSHPDQVDVNLRCLDDPVPANVEIRPFDGSEWEVNVESIR